MRPHFVRPARSVGDAAVKRLYRQPTLRALANQRVEAPAEPIHLDDVACPDSLESHRCQAYARARRFPRRPPRSRPPLSPNDRDRSTDVRGSTEQPLGHTCVQSSGARAAPGARIESLVSPTSPRGLRAGRHVGLLMGPALFTGTHRCIDPRAHIFLTATQRRRHDHTSGCPRCPLLATPSRPHSPETSGYVSVYVLQILGCLVTARRLLYQSKPSIEVTNVNAATPECKAGEPGPFRPPSAPDGPTAWPIPALHPPRGIQVSGRNAVQLRSCGGRIRRFVGRLAHRRSLRPPRAKCGVRPQTNRGCRPRKRPANCQLR